MFENLKTVIDRNGKIVEIGVFVKDDGKIVDYTLRDGEKCVDYVNSFLTLTNGVKHSHLKPRWNGSAWVELATQEEIEKAYPNKQQADEITGGINENT